MCFRPSVASKVVPCPHCKKELTIQPGTTPKKCPFCGGDFPQDIQVKGTQNLDK